MNKLVEIVILWSSHETAFHINLRQLYNIVKLDGTENSKEKLIKNANLWSKFLRKLSGEGFERNSVSIIRTLEH